MKCNCCHTCGTSLLTVLDGEEWCLKCETLRRYASHGWGRGEGSACPSAETPRADAKAPRAQAVVASSMARADAAGLIGRLSNRRRGYPEDTGFATLYDAYCLLCASWDDLLAERYAEREALDRQA